MADTEAAPFTPPGVDRFEEWLHAPATLESSHAHVDIRRAVPAEFDAIYDLVNETFGFKKPHAVYEWLYRRNPYGLARCWIVVERASGRLIASTAFWPWPLARGTQPLEGTLGGDTVVAADWQRRGIATLRNDTRKSHAWQDTFIGLSWPNQKSRRRGIKQGRAQKILGPVPLALLVLDTKAFLTHRGWPAIVGAPAALATDGLLRLWRRIMLRAEPGQRVEAVRRFDGPFDAVTRRCTAWAGYWCPHDATFLNWRYLDHPAGRYTAFALVAGDALAGYAVLRYGAHDAWLMEFVAPAAPARGAATLLRHVVGAARAAGCATLRFSAPRAWPHWPLLRAAGFASIRSELYLWAGGDHPEPWHLDRWKWGPGDMDDL